ncbi:MAG TPA: DMT family transporter [Blastocatellia bacterium]|nr:DMT family transporter [Blastocatellia bacterium]
MTEAAEFTTNGTPANTRRSRVYPAMAGAVTALAFSSVFVKKLEGLDVPAVVVAFYRVALAALLLAPFTLWLKRKELIAMRRSEYALLLAAGLCLAVHFGAWIASLEYIPIAASVVLVDSHPILVAIASYFVLGEVLAPRSLAGAILGIIGTVVICKDGFLGMRSDLLGDGLALLGAFAMVGYLLAGRKVRNHVSLLGYATPVYLACSLFLLMWAGVSGSRVWPYGRLEWILFAALAIVPTILGHTVLNWAIRHVPATGISISFLGEPVVAAALAFFFFGQKPSTATLIGSTLVLAGIYLTLTRRR